MTSDSAAQNTPEDQGTDHEAAQAESAQTETAQDATKRRFREALQAKQSRHGEDHVGTDPHGTDHGHGPVDAKRVFRRKTG